MLLVLRKKSVRSSINISMCILIKKVVNIIMTDYGYGSIKEVMKVGHEVDFIFKKRNVAC